MACWVVLVVFLCLHVFTAPAVGWWVWVRFWVGHKTFLCCCLVGGLSSTLSGSRSTPCERPPPVGGGCLRSQPVTVVLLVWVVCGGLFVICIVVASIFVLYCFLCFV